MLEVLARVSLQHSVDAAFEELRGGGGEQIQLCRELYLRFVPESVSIGAVAAETSTEDAQNFDFLLLRVPANVQDGEGSETSSGHDGTQITRVTETNAKRSAAQGATAKNLPDLWRGEIGRARTETTHSCRASGTQI